MSVIFRSRIAILAIAIFCLLSKSSESHGGALSSATVEDCAVRIGKKLNTPPFEMIDHPPLASEGAKIILNVDEPEATNKMWIASLAQSFETHLELNNSLEYVPHSLYSETHTFIDKTIASREKAFLGSAENKTLPWIEKRRISNTFEKIKADSLKFNSPSVRQVDFLYFTRNAVRIFAAIDGEGHLTAKGKGIIGGILGEFYLNGRRDEYYEVWGKLSRESLLIPTTRALSMPDFDLSSPYPIYFWDVSDFVSKVDGSDYDSEGKFLHDDGHNTDTNSRFVEIMETMKRWLSTGRLKPEEISLLKNKISERLELLKSIYALGHKRAPTLRQRRILTVTLFYTLHEREIIGTFIKSQSNLKEIAMNFRKKLSPAIKENILDRVNNYMDMGFNFKERVTPTELDEAIEILQDALNITSKI